MSVVTNRISKHICSIIINRPEKRNALNLETFKNLQSSLQEFDNDKELRIAIVAGAGGTFCAGYDLNEILDQKTGMPDIQRIEQMLLPMRTRLCEKKLTIAAVDGHAAGIGYELALRCDFRVGDRDTRLGFLNRRFGIPILNGGTVILPKLVGMARAMDLVATGKAQLAPEALQYGILNQIADIGCAFGRALNYARSLAKFDPPALLHDLNNLTHQDSEGDSKLLFREREKSLAFCRQVGQLDVAMKFLKGELCRHGNTDLGNMAEPKPEVTL